MDRALDHNKVGVAVACAECGRTKAPRGRSVPAMLSLCGFECPGYDKPPFPGSLWPGESEAEFGYAVADEGTRKD